MEITKAQFARIEGCLPLQRGNVSVPNLQVLSQRRPVRARGPRRRDHQRSPRVRRDRPAKEWAVLNAYVALDEAGAIAAARRVDAARGKSCGPRLGVPLVVVDNIELAGMPMCRAMLHPSALVTPAPRALRSSGPPADPAPRP